MRIRCARTWLLGLATLGMMAIPARADWQRSFSPACGCNSGAAAPIPSYPTSAASNYTPGTYAAGSYGRGTYTTTAQAAPAPTGPEFVPVMPQEAISYAPPPGACCTAPACTTCCEEKRPGLLARIKAKCQSKQTTTCCSPCDTCCEKSKHPILDRIRARREARKAERECCPPPCCPAPACCPAPSCSSCSPY